MTRTITIPFALDSGATGNAIVVFRFDAGEPGSVAVPPSWEVDCVTLQRTDRGKFLMTVEEDEIIALARRELERNL